MSYAKVLGNSRTPVVGLQLNYVWLWTTVSLCRSIKSITKTNISNIFFSSLNELQISFVSKLAAGTLFLIFFKLIKQELQ